MSAPPCTAMHDGIEHGLVLTTSPSGGLCIAGPPGTERIARALLRDTRTRPLFECGCACTDRPVLLNSEERDRLAQLRDRMIEEELCR